MRKIVHKYFCLCGDTPISGLLFMSVVDTITTYVKSLLDVYRRLRKGKQDTAKIRRKFRFVISSRYEVRMRPPQLYSCSRTYALARTIFIVWGVDGRLKHQFA